jgi:hypothetical protein
MDYQGQIENGVVVFREPVPLPNGTKVRVEPLVIPSTSFWESCSLAELAVRQGIALPRSPEEMFGGWPDDELDDGFENTIHAWRERELEHAR